MEEKVIISGTPKGGKFFPVTLLLLAICSAVGGFVAIDMSEDYMAPPLWILAVILFTCSIIMFFYCQTSSIHITDKRVYGKAAFGRRVDLPMDFISAVATIPFWKGISVSTASGLIKFLYIENSDQIYSELSNLLIERQNRKSQPITSPDMVKASEADELKNFKDLLDKGIITQKEFDAKKKQILGL